MQKRAVFVISVGALAFLISSTLLVFAFNYSIYDILKEFCVSVIIACFIAVPNACVTLIHDNREIRREQFAIIQTTNKELRALSELLENATTNGQALSSTIKNEIKACGIRLNSLVPKMLVQLAENQMNNDALDCLVKGLVECTLKISELDCEQVNCCSFVKDLKASLDMCFEATKRMAES